MSKKYPIIAVTGSSGAGTSNVMHAFNSIFRRANISPSMVEGDSFHRFDRQQMRQAILHANNEGKPEPTHFGSEGNLFENLETLFREYGNDGTGLRRRYIHNEDEAERFGSPPGTLTSWETLEANTDLLFYEGLHGGLVNRSHNVAQHVDLLIGVTPIVNLEWMQKISRDRQVRGYSTEAAVESILGRMSDYVHYIVPQFSLTDINFQRVPTVDTSNPFAACEVPTNDESYTVIHIRNSRKLKADFRALLEMLAGSFMSTPDTIVVPSGKMIFAMELILLPVIEQLLEARNAE